MMDLKLGNLLLEMRKNYTEQPVFLFTEKGETAKPVMYPDFLADLDENVKKAENMKPERIAVAGYNTYDWIVTAVSLLLAGKTLILMNPDISDHDFLYLLEYTDTECVMLLEELKSDFGFLKGHFQTEPLFSGRALSGTPSGTDVDKIQFSDHKSEFLCFTSGTSKSSKGVVINTETLVNHVRLVVKEAVLPMYRDDKWFMPLPLYHIYAFTFLFHIMAVGTTLCLTPSPRYLVQAAHLFNPQVALLVPSMVELLIKKPELLPDLKAIITGGGACRAEVADTVRKHGITYLNGYGSSESIAMTFLSVPGEDEQWMKPLSCIQCGVSEDGELWIRTPYHFDEYYKRPEDTKRSLDGDVIWTGDAAVMNEKGYIHLIGRLRDMIVMENGEKIHAEDMDNILAGMEHVAEAAVVYSTEYGMSAAVVPDSMEHKESIQQQVAAYNKDTSPQLRIRHLWVRETKLPRTTTGKLKRYQLENEFKEWLLAEEDQ